MSVVGLYADPRRPPTFPDGPPYRRFLRLLDDGVAVSVPSLGAPEEVAAWLTPTHPYVAVGTWTLDDGLLVVHTTSTQTSSTWRGWVSGEGLELALEGGPVVVWTRVG